MAEIETVEIVEKRRYRFFIPGPPLALLMFAQALTGAVLVDLIVYRTCQVSLNITHVKCLLLRSNASSPEAQKLETKIEPYASMIIMGKSLVESILPAVLSLFLGPWSDRGGRKPLLLGGFIGFTLMNITLSLMCNWNISPWYLLIPSVLGSMMGGVGAIIFASVCYISDTSTEKDRTTLLAGIQVSILGGYVIGVFAGPLIYNEYGYTMIFSVAAMCGILSVFYTYFCVPETVTDTSKVSIFGLFKVSFVRELVTNSWVKREGFHRSVVWLTMSMLAFGLMVVEGEIAIGYLFTRERLQWDVQHYSYVSGAAILLNMVGVMFGVWLFSHVLKFPDTLVAVIGMTSSLGASITKSLAWQPWHMYLAPCIGMFSGIIAPVLRSIISKSVPAQDLGKVFSLTGSLEMLSPLAGTPLYTMIYSHYLPPVYPSPVYLVSAGFHVLLVVLTVWIEVLIRKSRKPNYAPLVQDDQ